MAARPDLPEALTDRQQDIWEPLLSVADLAGDEWSRRARLGAVEIYGEDKELSEGALLLAHIRAALDGHDQITTKDLLEYLVKQDDAQWAIWWGKALTEGNTRGPAARLAKLLKPYGIRSKDIWLEEEKKSTKGFEPSQFEDAWARYLPPPKVGRVRRVGRLQVALTWTLATLASLPTS
jgi:putative DNA primase/helicase